jgi:dextranase
MKCILVAAVLAAAPAVLAAQGVLAAPAAMAAGRLSGPIIDDVTTDRVMYAPGQPVDVAVALSALGSGHFTGTLTLTLWNGRGEQIDQQTQHATAAGASSGSGGGSGAGQVVHFILHPPANDGRGYLFTVRADGSDGQTDTASGAVDVSTDWHRFPRYGWVAQFKAGTDGAAVVDLLASYHLNALQFYDVAHKAHVPEPPAGAATWPNLANQPVSRAVVNAMVSEAHARGMIGLLFTDWTAGYDDYATDGSGAKLSWGLFTRPCSKTQPCTEADQYTFSGGPGVWKGYGWATDSLKIFDPANVAWQNLIFAGVRNAIKQMGLDGWQIDTLGAPQKPLYTYSGKPRDMGAYLAPFANAAVKAVGGHDVLNDVSRWDGDTVAAKTRTDILYTEIHPEFGDTPYYTSLNGFTAQTRKLTSRPLVIAAYMDQSLATSPPCKANAAKCTFNEPGIRYVDSMMLASGASHFELGDQNAGCAARQAKMASNIFLPGAMLCMSQSLSRWLVDALNFGVGYENLLRDGISDAVEPASLTGPVKGAITGAAGTVYLMPKTRAGMQILHLLNFSDLPTIRLDDLDGKQPAPHVLSNLTVTMHYAGNTVSPSRNRLMWASPDVDHGAPQQIGRYTVGQDAAGKTVTFTLPSLQYWDMVWLETGGFAGKAFGLHADVPLRGTQYQDASDGAGSYSTILHICCGQSAHYAGLQFGAGVTAFALRAGNVADADVVMTLDQANGWRAATLHLPATGGLGNFQITTVPASAIGNHDLFLSAPDEPLSVESMTFQ